MDLDQSAREKSICYCKKHFPWRTSPKLISCFLHGRLKWTSVCSLLLDWPKSAHIARCHHWFPPEWRLWNERRNSILMTCHYPDLGSAFDWSSRVGNLLQPIRSTTQIWVVTRHQSEFLRSFYRRHLRGNKWWRREMSAGFSGYY